MKLRPEAILFLASIFSASAASAACPESTEPEEPEVRFTYPTDGDDDVPADGLIWLSTNGNITASLNGERLSRHESLPAYDPGPLSADAPYLLEVAVETDGVSTTETIQFSSSGELGQQPDRPEDSGIETYQNNDHLSTACLSEHNRACYDTGQDTHYVASVGVSSFLWRVAYLGDSKLVRGECTPSVYLPRDAVGQNLCLTVTAISSSGVESEAVEVCSDVNETDTPMSCSARIPLTNKMPGVAVLALLPLLALRRSTRARMRNRRSVV